MKPTMIGVSFKNCKREKKMNRRMQTLEKKGGSDEDRSGELFEKS